MYRSTFSLTSALAGGEYNVIVYVKHLMKIRELLPFLSDDDTMNVFFCYRLRQFE
jgi:hypothetical protein